MIVVWQTLTNRRRISASRAMRIRDGHAPVVSRVQSSDVAAHILLLTSYLVSPSPAARQALEDVEQKAHPGFGAAHLPVAEHLPLSRPGDAGERVLGCFTRNLLTDSLEDRQAEFILTALMSPGRSGPTEHFIISWPRCETPSIPQVEQAMDILLDVAGLQGRQVFAAVHGDTDNLHLHIMASRIDPSTGEWASIGSGGTRGLEALHMGISVAEHRGGWRPEISSLYYTGGQGTVDRRTGIMVLDGSLRPCASTANWRAIRAARRVGPDGPQISAKSRRFEERTGIKSFQRRVREDVVPALLQAPDWHGLHAQLAPNGMRCMVPGDAADMIVMCGDRAVSAATACGHRLVAQTSERLGPHVPPPTGLIIAPWVDRTFPSRTAATERELARRSIKAAQTLCATTVQEVRAAARLRVRDELDALEAPDRGASLNASRQRIAREGATTRGSADDLLSAYRRRCADWRARLRRGCLDPAFLDEHDPAAPGVILLGPRGGGTSLLARTSGGFTSTQVDRRIDYYEDGALAFVEHAARIEVHLVRSGSSIREALLLAHEKWGEVVVAGDQSSLERVAEAALEQQVPIANLAMRKVTVEVQARAAAAAARESALDAEILEDMAASIRRRSQAQADDVAVLRSHSPAFGAWYRGNVLGDMRNGARARAILDDPALRRELEDIEGRRYGIAAGIRRDAERERRRMEPAPPLTQELHAEQRKGERPTAADRGSLKDISAAQSSVETSAHERSEIRRAEPDRTSVPSFRPPGSPPPPPVAGNMAGAAPTARHRQPGSPLPDEDLRTLGHRLVAERDRDHRDLRAGMQEALAQRSGGPNEITPFAAGLLLRIASRRPEPAGGGALMRRDEEEAAILRRDGAFAVLLARATTGDVDLRRWLRARYGDVEGRDVLGLVPVINGRVDFSHRHDPRSAAGRVGSAPAWLAGRALDRCIKQLPRLHREDDGTVGLLDRKLVERLEHNYVGMLAQDVQARLEAAWRVQRERRRYLLALIEMGSLELEPVIRRNAQGSPFGCGLRVLRAPQPALEFPSELRQDLEFVFQVLRASRSRGRRAAVAMVEPTVAAWRHARAEESGPAVLGHIADQLLDESDRVPARLDCLTVDDRKLMFSLCSENTLSRVQKSWRSIGRALESSPIRVEHASRYMASRGAGRDG